LGAESHARELALATGLPREPDQSREGASPRRERLSLAPIRALLDRLGAPERGLSVIHVAGSKGKGSTALFAESVLRAAGARVGTFTSPHLERWTERFRIDGDGGAADRLAAAVAELRPHVDALRDAGGDTVPSFFDATTAAALLLFRDLRVDHAVLEVGLGGRLDSTNAVAPAVCCITSIELEHTDLLGDTLAAIAGEKAGILKPGVPAVCGELPREAFAVVERRAAGARLSSSRGSAARSSSCVMRGPGRRIAHELSARARCASSPEPARARRAPGLNARSPGPR
jgi:dihydrofolate synthase/folylpolyglutamate synthase